MQPSPWRGVASILVEPPSRRDGTSLAVDTLVLRDVWPAIALLLLVACGREAKPDAIARTVSNNVAALVEQLDRDTTCGFESPSATVVVDGAPGTLGSATWTIDDCVLDLGATVDTSDCQSRRRALGGVVRVAGSRTVVGTVTGDPNVPVVADGPDATTIILSGSLDDFVGEGPGDIVSVTHRDGTFEVTARVRRAASSAGACTVTSPNIELIDLAVADSNISIVDGSLTKDMMLERTALFAVRGRIDDRENLLAGTVVLDRASHEVPQDGAGLDPAYSPAAFLESYTCEPNIALPVSYDCASPSAAAVSAVARRAVSTMGIVARIAHADTTCGFGGASSTTVEAASANEAMATTRIERCRIELGDAYVVSDNCDRGETIASGAIVVSGMMHVRGRTVTDRTQPVIPSGDDAVTFELTEVLFDGFSVERNGDRVTFVDGMASGTVRPRLARSDKLGICTVPTPVAAYEHIAVSSTLAVLDTPTMHARLRLASAELDGVSGRWGDHANEVVGSAVVKSTTFDIAGALDPAFDPARSDADWQCGEAATNAPFLCDVSEAVAVDVARASALMFQTLGEMIDDETQCGFSSAGVVAAVQTTGEIGRRNGRGAFTVSGCALQFDSPTVIHEDCYGRKTWVQGRAVVSGTKTVDGFVSGDAAEPMVPTSRSAVRFDIDADLDAFEIWQDDGPFFEHRLQVVRGAMSGAFVPRVAIDEDDGLCSLITPEARVSDLVISNAVVRSARGAQSLEMQIPATDLDAIVGRLSEDQENEVFGFVTIDGEQVALAPGRHAMMPDYDAPTFAARYSCRPKLLIPFDDADCDAKQVLAEVGARLLVQSLGTVTEVANGEDFDCAFGGSDILDSPTQVVGQLESPGYIQWQVTNCRLAYANNRQGQPYDQDCRSHDKYLDGAAVIDGQREVDGIRDEISGFFSDVDYVRPQRPNSTRIDYRSIVFSNFSTYTIAPGETAPEQRMTIHSGTMSAHVEPMTGPDDGSDEYFAEGEFAVPTPIARITDLSVSGIEATIDYDGKKFVVRIDGADLNAFSGSWVGAPREANHLDGSVVVDGRTIEILPRSKLDPDYDQVVFDETYVCAERLLETLPPAP